MMMTTVVMRTSGGLTVRTPSESNIRATLESLARDGHVIIENEGETGPDVHYIQVQFRSNGIYALEYRAGRADKHFQTLTISRDKVAEALSGWLAKDNSWQDSFEWKSIGDWFTQ
jgi:hypothetical protein